MKKEGYYLFVEPLKPPSWRLNWSTFCPDIFGVFTSKTESRFVLVECETNPRVKRAKSKVSKISRNLSFQKRLNEKHILRMLLLIPSGTLHRVNYPEIRRFWEIWIISHKGEIIHKLPKKEKDDNAGFAF